jgi:uncharacterized protein (TIGR02147 family)
MIYQYNSYRSFLRSALSERMTQNSKFSLRAFARQLDLSPAILSQVLSGKRNFSQQTSFKVSHRLNLNSEQSDYFCLLIQYETEKMPELRANLQERINKIKFRYTNKASLPVDLELEQFKLISDWYHIPIVEMTELKNFEFCAVNVARKLGISKLDAQVAIERLERLELIEKVEENCYQKTRSDYVFQSKNINFALNKFHRQMLNKAVDSLVGQKRSERQIVSNTFSIDPKLLPQACDLIEKFRSELVQLFNGSVENTETYHMGLQLFRLTENDFKNKI